MIVLCTKEACARPDHDPVICDCDCHPSGLREFLRKLMERRDAQEPKT